MDWICEDCGMVNFGDDPYAETVTCEICGHVFLVKYDVSEIKKETKAEAE